MFICAVVACLFRNWPRATPIRCSCWTWGIASWYSCILLIILTKSGGFKNLACRLHLALWATGRPPEVGTEFGALGPAGHGYWWQAWPCCCCHPWTLPPNPLVSPTPCPWIAHHWLTCFCEGHSDYPYGSSWIWPERSPAVEIWLRDQVNLTPLEYLNFRENFFFRKD